MLVREREREGEEIIYDHSDILFIIPGVLDRLVCFSDSFHFQYNQSLATNEGVDRKGWS